LPTRFVHTLNVPFGVVIGIIRTPPVHRSFLPMWSKYEVIVDVGAGGAVEEATITQVAVEKSVRN
jgi:hypothetical protein